MSNWKAPIHPGEILADELAEIGVTAIELGRRLGVSKNRLYQIINGSGTSPPIPLSDSDSSSVLAPNSG